METNHYGINSHKILVKDLHENKNKWWNLLSMDGKIYDRKVVNFSKIKVEPSANNSNPVLWSYSYICDSYSILILQIHLFLNGFVKIFNLVK